VKTTLTLLLASIYVYTQAQTGDFATVNGHSHNDYFQKKPFKVAFMAGMGSIEADVILKKNELYVAHCRFNIKSENTLNTLYIQPIVQAVRQGETCEPIQFLIDIKSNSVKTLAEIVRQLEQYPDVFNEKSLVKVIISGRRPKSCTWKDYPSFIQFDGRPYERYTPDAWQRIALISDKFKNYTSRWHKSIDCLHVFNKMENRVGLTHGEGKKIRFWATPDKPKAWRILMQMGVDYICTDKPQDLRRFLRR
jgi:alkaline phosphatase